MRFSHPFSFAFRLALVAGALTLPGFASADLEFQSLSQIGVEGDGVVGVGIQADSIVLAANLSGGPILKSQGLQPGGILLRTDLSGQTVLGSRRVGDEVRDLALDPDGNVVVATAERGVVKLDPELGRELWTSDTGGPACRVDVGSDGTVVALRYDHPDDNTKTGPGTIYLVTADGKASASFRGHRNTTDLCIDAGSKTVLHIGWRQARASDGKKKQPVQIAYLRGVAYDGTEKYTLYDWSTDREDPGFINRPTNNMADTRGYRVSIGEDGAAVAAFECAGGNHIFRWEPNVVDGEWVAAKDKKPKGDHFHAFHNSRSEHKTYLARYAPATGEFLRGQEFCARVDSGKANTLRVKEGAVAGLSDGRVLVSGISGANLPVTLMPEGSGDYRGGAYLALLNPAWNGRDACVRIQQGANAHAIATRVVDGRRIIAVAGSTSGKAEHPFTKINPLAPHDEIYPDAGFLCVLTHVLHQSAK